MKTIYINGKVYTGCIPLVQAFAVEDDKFVFAGTNDEAMLLKGEEDKVVDLNGNFVCSGFNDSHMHLVSYGRTLGIAQLNEHTESLADMLSYLKEFKANHTYKDGEWLVGRGFNHDYFKDTDRLPNRYDLDKVATDVPICVIRACGHCLSVNSKALELLCITGQTKQPYGGHIGMTDNEPDGLFMDNAMDIVYAKFPAPTVDDIKTMILNGMQGLNSYGVTSCQTDDYCVFGEKYWQVIDKAYSELEQEGKMTVRVYEQSNFTNLDNLKTFVEAGNVTKTGSNMYKMGPLKMLGDGSLGARTAYLSVPYADDETTQGFPIFTQETMDKMIDYANANGMQVAVHTIGDKCLDMVLDAYEKALANHPVNDHRYGIVHCQITRKDQLDRIAKLNLVVYCQSIFLDYDNHIVEKRVGKKLASTSYSWKTLMKNGVYVSNGTDCPVELPNVLKCMQCGITRTTLDGTTGPYLPDEAFTVQEAIDSYTCKGAFVSFEENIKGMIRKGMLADFVILAKSPFDVETSAIKDIPIVATYLGGKKVFGEIIL